MAQVDDDDGFEPRDWAGEERRREEYRWLRELIEGLFVKHQRDLTLERKKERRRAARVFTGIAVGYLVLLFAGGLSLYLLEQHDANRARANANRIAGQAKRVETANLAECKRVKLLRAQANGTSELLFATLWVSGMRERALARPGSPDRATHLASVKTIDLLANRAKHTDQTDCSQAVFHPDTYIPPKPRRFDAKHNKLTQRLIGLLKELGAPQSAQR